MSGAVEIAGIADTGLRRGAENFAFDRHWLAGYVRGEHGALLRFHRSHATVSLGRHQCLSHEVRVAHCEGRGVDICRRESGGGAIYLDPGQLCFSLVFRRPPAWRDWRVTTLLGFLSSGVGGALRSLGIPAAVKLPNDVEVDGRKVASLFLACEGDALLLQGNVILRAEVQHMLEALRVPTEKLSPDGLAAARERIVGVEDLAGGALSTTALMEALRERLEATLPLRFAAAHEGALAKALGEIAAGDEAPRARAIDWAGDADGAVETMLRTGAGTLRARCRFGGAVLGEVEFATDAHIGAARGLAPLAEALAGAGQSATGATVRGWFAGAHRDLGGIEVEDARELLARLWQKRLAIGAMGLDGAEAGAIMLHTADGAREWQEILARAGAMLVPYCAKPAWCKWRHRDGCTECGLCEVGEAYRMARSRGMRVVTVTRYEHLVRTLAELREQGVRGYVGMCCGNFYLKRYRAFADAGLPALLMDIGGANCYELRQEDQAYAGTFQAQAQINAPLLRKVMRFAPHRGGGSTATAGECPP